MIVSLTGATGFLGRYLTHQLLSAGHQVRAWCRCSPDAEHLDARVDWVRGCLGDRDATEQLINGSNAVVHSAVFRTTDGFMGQEQDPGHYFDVNVGGSLNLLEAAAKGSPDRFVFISSGAVHDQVLEDRPLDETHPLRPKTLYGAYKAAVENLIHHYGMSQKLYACSVRPTAIYGQDEPIQESKWFDLVRRVVAGDAVSPTGGSKEVHAADVARAVDLLLTTPATVAGETFNCCDRMISHHEVATIAKRLSGSDAKIDGTPKQAKHQIETAKIQSLGMRFGGTNLLEQTISSLVQAVT